MSGIELFVDDIDGRLHAAAVTKRGLEDLYVDGPDMACAWAGIYLGKVTKIDKSLDAAIVDIGNGQSGFLAAKHVHLRGADPAETRTGIAELLKPGQNLIVQVKSEARAGSMHENSKLAKLTTKIYIIGQYAVYCPMAERVTMSRRLDNEDIITLTAKLRGKGGWIIQQSANNAAPHEILRETEMLEKEWQIISSEAETSDGRPRLLKAGPNALHRALLDHGARSFDHIHVGNKNILQMMTDWCAKHDPDLATSKRLRLFRPEKIGQRLFEIHDIYAEIEALGDRAVPLPSGGSLIIDPTHAVVMVDVNQGGGHHAVEANVEAASEIARQIRLRNLSGAIIVDFINMSQRSERARVGEALEAMLSTDTAGALCHGFTRIGLFEITRKRRGAMYFEKLRKVTLLNVEKQ